MTNTDAASNNEQAANPVSADTDSAREENTHSDAPQKADASVNGKSHRLRLTRS